MAAFKAISTTTDNECIRLTCVTPKKIMLIKERGAVAHLACVKSVCSSCVCEGFPGTPGSNYSCLSVHL